MKNKVLLIGSGAHAERVLDIFTKSHSSIYDLAIYDDDSNKWGSQLFGYTIVNSTLNIDETDCFFHISIGDNELRSQIHERLVKLNLKPLSILDETAYISAHAKVGEGTYLGPKSTVGPNADIGYSCIIGANTTIDVRVKIGHFVRIPPGVTICNGAQVGDRSLIYAGAVILPGVKIGSNVTIGAGAIIHTDVPDNEVIYGPKNGAKGLSL